MIDNIASYFFRKIAKMIGRKSKKAIINDIIDTIFHPFFGKYMAIPEVLDFIAHSINEGKVDFEKFIKYNLPTAISGTLITVIYFLRELGFYGDKKIINK